jgi:hypothetical protein
MSKFTENVRYDANHIEEWGKRIAASLGKDGVPYRVPHAQAQEIAIRHGAPNVIFVGETVTRAEVGQVIARDLLGGGR